MKLSIVISARNEENNIIHTIHSILNDLETFLTPQDFEIIIVNNCSDDRDPVHTALKGTTEFLSCRGAYNNGIIKILYDPIAGNVSARNKGAAIAKGNYLFFSDAHMSYSFGFFKRMIQTIEETDGIVHAAYSWMGAYPHAREGMGYSIKLGEEFKGSWNPYVTGDGNNWFYIPSSGHCVLGMKRKQFLDFHGYPEYLRCYGGGELALDATFWMLGSTSVCEPRTHCYHLSAGRGYNYVHDDYIHNVFFSSLMLSADMWAERTKLNYLRKNRPEIIEKLWTQAEQEVQEHRKFIEEKRVMTFNDMIATRPWDIKNIEKFGKSNSGMLIYNKTWIEEIKKTPMVYELWEKSELQKSLSDFIDKNLKQFCYKEN